MRIYKYILVLVVAMSTMTSCNYLDKEPDTELTLDMVFDDKVRMEGWLAYVYSGLPDPLWGYTNKYGCAALADDLRPSYLWYQWSWDCNQRAIGMWATNTSWNGDVWANMPRKIREAKIFMENVHTIDSDNVYQSDVDNMKLECRALIAYYYWWFLYWYGPCPFDPESPSVPSSTPIDELKYGQEPWDTIVDWLDNELKTVGDLLPVEYSEGDKFGRINRFFCYCTRARMLLFNASPLVNGNPMYYDHVNHEGVKLFPQSYDANKWQRALEANKAVIDLAEEYGYELFKAYNDDGTIDPFMSLLGGATTPFNPQGGNNREVLFACPSVSYTTWVAYNTPYGYKGNGGMSVSQSLVDAFALSNGIYLEGRFFMQAKHTNHQVDQVDLFDLSYDASSDAVTDSTGRRIYEFYLRVAQEGGTGDSSTWTTTNAFVIEPFLSEAKQRESALGLDSIHFRINYPSRFNSDTTGVIWSRTNLFSLGF